LPSRAIGGAGGVGLQALAEGVADLPLERSQRFPGGLALGCFLVVAGAAVAVPVADLGDRGHVDGVVEAPVSAQRQPAGDAVAGGHPGRGGAVAGGEPVFRGEPGDVADVADHGGGDGRADAEDVGQGRAGGADRGGQLLLRLAQLGAGAAQVGQVFRGQLTAGLLDGTGRPGLLQDAGRCGSADLPADPAGESGRSTACSRHTTWLRARLRSRCRLACVFSTVAWSSGLTLAAAAERSAARAADRASLGSSSVRRPGGQLPHPRPPA